MKFTGNSEEYIILDTINSGINCHILKESIATSLSVLWFSSDDNKLNIDGVDQTFNENQIVFLTEFHKVDVTRVTNARFLQFNRSFYCVANHDEEVSCKGLLFFGASELPIIDIPEEDIATFETLWKMFVIEMESFDSLQMEMLQTMLKRYLILCARVYKLQHNEPEEKTKLDIIREFNYLVEKHFKTRHTVTEYADLLNRSPKTLSNIFSKSGHKTPLQYIQNRKLLEARRLLRYTDRSIKEIAYELGYDDLQTFSRFFKKNEQVSPSDYRLNV